jgi:FAD/FMN-containing dehydrogenase
LTPPVRLAGHWHHTAAIGRLVTSLYAAGRPEYRSGPADPSPGVASITAVLERLRLKGLDQVVEVKAADGWVMAEGRCRLDGLRVFLARRGLALVPGPRPAEAAGGGAGGGSGGWGRGRRGRLTVGAGVIGGQLDAMWVDVLTKSGQLTREAPAELPPDGLVVAAALAVRPAPDRAAGDRDARRSPDAASPNGRLGAGARAREW